MPKPFTCLCFMIAVQWGIGFMLQDAVLAAAEDDNVVWIDLRSASEYRKGHIEGAINIPHGDIGHKIVEFVDDRFKEIHLYDGNSGTFAGLALEIMMELGFHDVVNEGSYEQLLGRQKQLQP